MLAVNNFSAIANYYCSSCLHSIAKVIAVIAFAFDMVVVAIATFTFGIIMPVN